jgi:hypothetical protein
VSETASERDDGDAHLTTRGIGGAEIREAGKCGASGEQGSGLQGGTAGDVHGEMQLGWELRAHDIAATREENSRARDTFDPLRYFLNAEAQRRGGRKGGDGER